MNRVRKERRARPRGVLSCDLKLCVSDGGFTCRKCGRPIFKKDDPAPIERPKDHGI